MKEPSFSIHSASERIVEVLHEEGIPIGHFQRVFDDVIQKVKYNTIPYSPKSLSKNAFPTDCTTSKATVPTG